MNHSVAYLTNMHPFYLKMALTSVGMLRSHNKKVPVRVYLIRDNAHQTIERENVSRHHPPLHNITDQFIIACQNLDVEVCERLPLSYPGEETFFHINRKYLSEVPEPNVLYIDADTFIFGDIESIFDHYPHEHIDFAACKAIWALSRGWQPDFLPKPVGPFSSGVMLWNNYSIRDWCDRLPSYLADFRRNDTPLANWLHGLHSDCLLREEFSVSKHISLANLTHSFIDPEDCHLIRNEQEIADLGKSLIFHCYTPNWKKCYHKLHGKSPKLIAKGKIKKDVQGPNPYGLAQT